ncbi:MAG: hypothetical protein HYW22_02710, partial [Candidatus Aenigmarchaeota archaeon]|nr:hypothetical protein [Candidatus Aenigmarchaeota archaeon]
IQVVGFSKDAMPEIVKSPLLGIPYHESEESRARVGSINHVVPEGILGLFQEGGKDVLVHDGTVWERKHHDESGGYNMYTPYKDLTPIVKDAYENPALQAYLNSLGGYVGRRVSPTYILPTWDRDSVFAWAFLIPGTKYQVGFNEQDKKFYKQYRGFDGGVSTFNLMMGGPRLGRLMSGPTLMGVFTFGTLTYKPDGSAGY